MIEDLFLDSRDRYGIIIVLGDETILYEIDEKMRYKKLDTIHARIQNNHRRGGQSQARISRLRDEQIHRYIMTIVESCKQNFRTNGVVHISSLTISGSGQKKEMLKDFLQEFKISLKILTYDNMEDILKNFNEAILNEINITENKKNEKEIKEWIDLQGISSADRLVFGDEIKELFDNGCLEKIWIIPDKVDDFKAKNKTKIIIVENSILKDFSGMIGLKYY